MISVIVPVYNVEPYLRKCLDSVIDQTYRDIEILVIDDGSTDGCGRICDEYAERDERVKVFHTENRGLSCARNLGLDEAQGEWIGFVDSDDWIEPDMYECLLSRALETGADVVECGYYNEHKNEIITNKRKDLLLSGQEAVSALLRGELSNSVWNKLWKKKCFSSVRFPPGRVFEDVATTYLVFYTAELVVTAVDCKYHYYWREFSLSRSQNANNKLGHWLSDKERYDYLYRKVGGDLQDILLSLCSCSIIVAWTGYFDCDKNERRLYKTYLREMNLFSKKNIPLIGKREWSWRHRIGSLFPHFNNKFSLYMAWILRRANNAYIIKRMNTRNKC